MIALIRTLIDRYARRSAPLVQAVRHMSCVIDVYSSPIRWSYPQKDESSNSRKTTPRRKLAHAHTIHTHHQDVPSALSFRMSLAILHHPLSLSNSLTARLRYWLSIYTAPKLLVYSTIRIHFDLSIEQRTFVDNVLLGMDGSMRNILNTKSLPSEYKLVR